MSDGQINTDWLPPAVFLSATGAFIASAKFHTGNPGQSIPYAVMSAVSASTAILIGAQYSEW